MLNITSSTFISKKLTLACIFMSLVQRKEKWINLNGQVFLESVKLTINFTVKVLPSENIDFSISRSMISQLEE